MLIMFSLIVLFIISAFLMKYLHNNEYNEMVQFANFVLMTVVLIVIICASVKIYRENVLVELSYTAKVYEKIDIQCDYYDVIYPELAKFKKEKFNAELQVYKRLAESPWTNWFCNKLIADMDYIILEE